MLHKKICTQQNKDTKRATIGADMNSSAEIAIALNKTRKASVAVRCERDGEIPLRSMRAVVFQGNAGEIIDLQMTDELCQSLNEIANLIPIQLVKGKVTAGLLLKLFATLRDYSFDAKDVPAEALYTVKGLTLSQQIVIEQYKLAIMHSVYIALLKKCNDEQRKTIVVEEGRQQEEKENNERTENVWWKRLLASAGFWLYFAYNVICEFFGYVAMMASFVNVAITTFNAATLIFSIPLTILSAILYIAFEGQIFGFKVAAKEKQKLNLFEEQLEALDKINAELTHEMHAKKISGDSYRNFALLAIEFNNTAENRQINFKPNDSAFRKWLYRGLSILGALLTIGGGYYAAITFIATMAAAGVIFSPAVAIIIIGAIIACLLVSFIFMQAKGLKAILIPTLEEEIKLENKIKTTCTYDQSYYMGRIQDQLISERPPLEPIASLFPDDVVIVTSNRLVEHPYSDQICHKRKRASSLTFAPGTFHKKPEEQYSVEPSQPLASPSLLPQ